MTIGAALTRLPGLAKARVTLERLPLYISPVLLRLGREARRGCLAELHIMRAVDCTKGVRD